MDVSRHGRARHCTSRLATPPVRHDVGDRLRGDPHRAGPAPRAGTSGSVRPRSAVLAAGALVLVAAVPWVAQDPTPPLDALADEPAAAFGSRAGPPSTTDAARAPTLDLREERRPSTPSCLVRGVLRTGSGQALAGAAVFLVARDDVWRRGTKTDADGHFAIEARPGPHVLAVPPVAHHRGVEQLIYVPPAGARADVTVARQATARVLARIVDSQRAPLPGVRATLWSVGSRRVSFAVETDRLGNFVLPEVPAGKIVLKTTEPIQTEVVGHRLAAGAYADLEFVLDIGLRDLRGRVASTAGAPVASAHVRLDRLLAAKNGARCVSTRTCVTDANGRFAFERIGPGTGTLTTLASGYTTEISEGVAESFHEVSLEPIESRKRRPRTP